MHLYSTRAPGKCDGLVFILSSLPPDLTDVCAEVVLHTSTLPSPNHVGEGYCTEQRHGSVLMPRICLSFTGSRCTVPMSTKHVCLDVPLCDCDIQQYV